MDPNQPIPSFPQGEPTSVLAFSDLIGEVAIKIGAANYGADGMGAAAIPTDPHDLALCKGIVNKAIRMFINDAPQTGGGWRWLNVIHQIDLWPQISYDVAPSPATYVTQSFNSGNGTTTLTLVTPATIASPPPASFAPAFFASMELRQIYLNGNPPSNTPGFFAPVVGTGPLIGTPYTILQYVSATQIIVDGNTTTHGYPTNCPFSFACGGDYTMPADFGGQYSGEITYIGNTNRGMVLHWTTEAEIRTRRQNYAIESGTPYAAAVRIFPVPSYVKLTNASGIMLPRRRWELMTWRISSDFLSVLIPYTIHFNTLVNLTDIQPAPFAHDETIKAACLAVAEKEVDDTPGPDWDYYRNTCLPNSYRIDARSAPRRLGYFGNPSSGGVGIQSFRNNWYQRPTVGVNGLS